MGDDPGEQGEDGDDQGEDEDDGCEHVKRPGGPNACDSHERSCGEGEQTCVANDDGCEEPRDDQCVATSVRDCDDPVETEPEPDDPVEEPEAGSEKLF